MEGGDCVLIPSWEPGAWGMEGGKSGESLLGSLHLESGIESGDRLGQARSKVMRYN